MGYTQDRSSLGWGIPKLNAKIFFLSLVLGPAIAGLGQVNAQRVEKLVRVSGDRQIVVGGHSISGPVQPLAPYVVRALDARGDPVAGAWIWFSLPDGYANPSCPSLYDEFGFRGFNVSEAGCPGLSIGGNTAGIAIGSGSDGLASVAPVGSLFPSQFPIAVSLSESGARSTRVKQIVFSAVRVAAKPQGQPSVVVEYHSQAFGHYFNALLQSEIDALDADVFPDWTRSVGGFIAYERQEDAPVGAVPVCRFFSSKSTSHFYTASQAECETVSAQWPETWQLETRAAFWIFEPNKLTGACASDQVPVYRLFNQKPTPNHRYVTDKLLRDSMVLAGWIAEGYGTESVMMCTPG